jgi:hypothetical protein
MDDPKTFEVKRRTPTLHSSLLGRMFSIIKLIHHKCIRSPLATAGYKPAAFNGKR